MYSESSSTLDNGLLVKTGASLVFATIMLYVYCSVSVLSVILKVTVLVPTSSFRGVPERVVPFQLNQLGFETLTVSGLTSPGV